MRHWNWIVAAMFGAAVTGTGAQAVYRCGNTYGSQPCEGGSMVAAPLAAPSRAEGAKAVQAAKVDAKRADAMVMGPKQAASAAKAKPTPPLKKPETFTAKGPAPAKKP